MKILALMGTARDNGNTTDLVKTFEIASKKHGDVEFEYLFLNDHPIPFCTGCHNCIFIGEDKCPHFKAVSPVEQKLLSADGIIMASPGYMFNVTGVMKNFLDHVAYQCHRPKYFRQKVVFLSSASIFEEKVVFTAMETWTKASGMQSVGKLASSVVPLPMKEKRLEKIRKKTAKLAEKFYKSILEKKVRRLSFDEQSLFVSMRALSEIAPGIMKADKDYFEEIGVYQNKKKKWYIEGVRFRPFSRLLSRLMEGMMHRMLPSMTDMEKLKNARSPFTNQLNREGE